MDSKLIADRQRYARGKIPPYQKYFRYIQVTSFLPLKLWYKFLFNYYKRKYMVELSEKTEIGEGLYFGHPYCITINPNSILGKNVNIHKGVTIGQENRGKRKGYPKIGNNVWVGVNSTIVGAIKIGDDVLIAPNTFVNRDIPDHSVVFGNPCIVKHKDEATKYYLSRVIE